MNSFEDCEAPSPGPDFMKQVKAKCPNVFMVFFRSKNENVVVYEAKTIHGKFDPIHPVDVYWLDIDPKYRANRRKDHIMHDRSDLTTFESSHVFGVTVKLINDQEAELRFVADTTQHPCRIKVNDKGAKLLTLYKANKESKEEMYLIRSAYVAATEPPNLLHLSSNVKELSINAILLRTQECKSIRIK
jgi:hypothetical protein